MEKEIKIYERNFGYEDMKVAMVVNEFYIKHEKEMANYETYEDLIELCIKIRQEWEDLEQEDATEEEYAYIQCFAENYLYNKFLKKESK